MTSPNSTPLLGDYEYPREAFEDTDQLIKQFRKKNFQTLSARQRFIAVSEALLKLISDAPKESFLLSSVVDFIDRINHEKILDESYHFTLFEFWLNHFTNISKEDLYLIRAKISGKHLPREDYQVFFPIGMGKVFNGTHFVAAHLSPDIDTTIASFWGWLDAFSAGVGTGQHIWSLPGGPPDSPVTKLFGELFGHAIFTSVARMAPPLHLSAIDLVTEKNLIRVTPLKSITALDHGYDEFAVILVDEEEHFLGDWRSSDVELVHQILNPYKSCLHWIENQLHLKLVSLFAEENLRTDRYTESISELFQQPIVKSPAINKLSEERQAALNAFFEKILEIPKGIRGTFSAMTQALNQHGIEQLNNAQTEIESLPNTGLFNSDGKIHENRSVILHRLESIIKLLNQATLQAVNFSERLEVVMRIKTEVLNVPTSYLTLRSDVEDVRAKMQNYNYLTVVVPEENGKFFPVGVVWASDLRMPVLGTVSIRDFCNEEEMHMASYLTVISVVDHHKSTLNTLSPPSAIIGDTQSCNVLIAEQNFQINDRYSTGGLSPENIAKQLKTLEKSPKTHQNIRITQRLLQKQMATQRRGDYFIHPHREFSEALCILHAILDDTDLLTKVTTRDVKCVCQLLNHMKSLSVGEQVEIINLDDIPKDRHFAKVAADKILRHPEMHSVYRKIYAFKEEEIELQLQKCEEGIYDNLFSDTKEQNGCCRVGQIKLFSRNIPSFQNSAPFMRQHWYNISHKINHNRPEIDLYLFMVSTVTSADDVFQNRVGKYSHKDELWVWIPSTQLATDHLVNFLNAFSMAKEVRENKMDLELLGPNANELLDVFQRNFSLESFRIAEDCQNGLPIAILRFDAGSINSRKSMISPYLPRLIS